MPFASRAFMGEIEASALYSPVLRFATREGIDTLQPKSELGCAKVMRLFGALCA